MYAIRSYYERRIRAFRDFDLAPMPLEEELHDGGVDEICLCDEYSFSVEHLHSIPVMKCHAIDERKAA